MHWLTGAPGHGSPDYCRGCKKHFAGKEQAPPCKTECSHYFEMLPENQPAAELFMNAGNCWRYRPNGTLQGLDWAQVDVLARWLGMAMDADELQRVKVLETTMIEAVTGGN